MTLQKARIPAVACAFAVLVCVLAGRPFVEIGLCDDGPYALMARNLASSGHIVYNGGTAAMIAFQLYLAAGFIKLFGFSFTAVRASTWLASVVTAFVLQRTLCRAGLNGRNATVGTLALVLSPLYLILSATFMSDITGLLAVVLCLYGCLRALQATTDRSAVAWLFLAGLTNAVCGTSRQIAWLGILIMIPATLWILRGRRTVVVGGAAVVLGGVIFIAACMHWLKQQAYVIPIPLFVSNVPVRHVAAQLVSLLLGIPFLLLPIFCAFLPALRKLRPLMAAGLGLVVLAYLVVALRLQQSIRLLEPTSGNSGSWVGPHGVYEGIGIRGGLPLFLPVWLQVLLTILCLCTVAGLILLIVRSRRATWATSATTSPSWKDLTVLLVPFACVYTLLLLANAGSTHDHDLYDRYALGLLVVVELALIRFYQERVARHLPKSVVLVTCFMALYGVVEMLNTFALERARVAINAEMAAQGVSASSVDNGWDYNFDVELEHASHINDPRIKVPAGSYVPVPSPPSGPCQVFWYDRTPHVHPVYSVSSDPNACYGAAPFAPVQYSRWPYRVPGTLYVVRYVAAARP